MLVIYNYTFLIRKIVPTENIIVMGNTVSLHKIGIGFSTVIFSIGLAILLNKFVGKPIESLRNRLRAAK